MKRIIAALFVIVLMVLAFQTAVRASEVFEWHADCQTTDPDSGQQHVWVGYTAPDDYTGGHVSYLGNGPGFLFDTLEAGQHDRVIDVLTDYGPVTLWEDVSDASITINDDTAAPDCSEGTGMQSGNLDHTDTGEINDPRLSDRANSCFSEGVICSTKEQWERGWYEIRQQYGLI